MFGLCVVHHVGEHLVGVDVNSWAIRWDVIIITLMALALF